MFPVRQAAELMSPPATTTNTELLQVKVKAALLKQSFLMLLQEKVCKVLQEPRWGSLG